MHILGTISSSYLKFLTAFESIATATGTNLSNTITFSSIPSTYQHLQIRFVGKSTQAATAQYAFSLRLNGDTGSNYTRHILTADAATSVSAIGTASQTSISSNAIIPGTTGIESIVSAGIIDIHDYLSTSKNKTIRAFLGSEYNRSSTPIGTVSLLSGLWFATPAAITSISLILGTGNWANTASFALYGIKGN